MNKHNSVPNIRFNGFEDKWKKSELKEIAKIVGGGTPDTNNSNYWNGNINWYSPNEIGKYPYVYSSHKKITNLGLKKSSAKLHPSEKTILFTSRAGIGDMAILKTEAATNQGFQSLELKNNINPYFVYSYGFKIKREAYKLASGSTFLEISKKDMEKINLWFPIKNEQQKIGDFFTKLDKLLDLQQQKIDKLELLKKALLQKLFPKHGAKIPELRFKGYKENWNEKKLNSITKRLDNYRKPITANKRLSGQTPYYGANGIQDYVKGYTHEGEFVLIAEDGANDVRNYPVRFVKGYIWVNNHAHVLQAKVGISNNLFLSYSLKSKNLLPYLVGSGRMKLNADVLMNLLLKIPDLNEQQKIGSLLSKVDQLIELENKKLQNLQQAKKCLLQNMFVE